MANIHIDYLNGDNSDDGSDWANAKRDFAGLSVSAGDVIKLAKSPDAVSIGSCSFTDGDGTVTIPSGTIKNINMCEGNWTTVTNVNAGNNTPCKQGTKYSQLGFLSAFTTGKSGYIAIDGGGTHDFSSYTKVSLWMRSSTAKTTQTWSLALCSDATGDIPVNTLPINVVLRANLWTKVTLDNGGALGSSIQSVAIYSDVDPGALNLLLDDIFACNDLHLLSVISKNTAGEPEWYSIRNINDTSLEIGANDDFGSTNNPYYGTTESVTTYARECIATDIPTTSPSIVFNQPTTDGTMSSPITVSGGWNTGSDTQDGLTFFHGQANYGYAYRNDSVDFVNMENIGFFDYRNSITNNGSVHGCEFTNIFGGGTDQQCIQLNSPYGVGDGIYATNSQNGGISIQADYGFFKNVSAVSCGSSGCGVTGKFVRFQNLKSIGNSLYDVNLSSTSRCFINGLETRGATNGLLLSASFDVSIVDWNVNNTTETLFLSSNQGSSVFSKNHDLGGVNKVIMNNGVITEETSVRHTASGLSWKIEPSTTNDYMFMFPQNLFRGYVASGVSVDVSLWVRKDSSYNGIAPKLVVWGQILDGITTDQTDSLTVGVDTWEQLVVTVTPSESGFILFGLLVSGTAGAVYVDDADIS